MIRALLVAASVALSGCAYAAPAALNIAGTIIVKAFELDTAIINNIRAISDAKADPNMPKGVIPERMPK